jgi:hypothetical protein
MIYQFFFSVTVLLLYARKKKVRRLTFGIITQEREPGCGRISCNTRALVQPLIRPNFDTAQKLELSQREYI